MEESESNIMTTHPKENAKEIKSNGGLEILLFSFIIFQNFILKTHGHISPNYTTN